MPSLITVTAILLSVLSLTTADCSCYCVCPNNITYVEHGTSCTIGDQQIYVNTGVGSFPASVLHSTWGEFDFCKI
jgi:hypothetical protein